MTMYPSLNESAQDRIRATVVPASGVVSGKMRAALEEDHYARTLLGQQVQALETRMAEMRRPVPGGGGPPAR